MQTHQKPNFDCRAVPLQHTGADQTQAACFRERFIVNLPLALVEQLLMPAPGDNPFAGTAIELKLSVYNANGSGGQGHLWGTAHVPILYSWLANQVR